MGETNEKGETNVIKAHGTYDQKKTEDGTPGGVGAVLDDRDVGTHFTGHPGGMVGKAQGGSGR